MKRDNDKIFLFPKKSLFNNCPTETSYTVYQGKRTALKIALISVFLILLNFITINNKQNLSTLGFNFGVPFSENSYYLRSQNWNLSPTV